MISYVKRAESYGNGYFRRRVPELLNSLQSLSDDSAVDFLSAKDSTFREISQYKREIEAFTEEQANPFTPSFLKRYPISPAMSELISEFVSNKSNAGDTLSAALEMQELDGNGVLYFK